MFCLLIGLSFAVNAIHINDVSAAHTTEPLRIHKASFFSDKFGSNFLRDSQKSNKIPNICIFCLDEGKQYYSEFVPVFEKALKEAFENPTNKNLDFLYKIHKRILIGAIVLLTTNKEYKDHVIGGVLKKEPDVLKLMYQLDTFYHDHIYGHIPTNKTKKIVQEFYKQIKKPEYGGYLTSLLVLLKKRNYSLKSS